MIREKDYLKTMKMMSESERKDYLARVEKWTDETFPRLVALADSWAAVPVKDFDEGLRLASALMKARSYISVANQYTARRSLEKLRGFLEDVRQQSGLAKLPYRPAGDAKRYRAIVPDKGLPQEDGTLTRREYVPQEVDNRRPEHLHQYIDLLPADLKKRTTKLPDMYLALAEYRGRVEVLSEHPDADQEMIADYARRAVEQEQEIRALWAEVDRAYYLATNGTPEQQAEAAARQQAQTTAQHLLKRPAQYTKEEIEQVADPLLREEIKAARIAANRDYLKRRDMKITDKYKAEMTLRIREMMAWGEPMQPRVKTRCAEAGIVVPGFNDDSAEVVESNGETEEVKEDGMKGCKPEKPEDPAVQSESEAPAGILPFDMSGECEEED